MAEEIHWQGRHPDTGHLITAPVVAIVRGIIDGESAVQEISEDYFRLPEHRHLDEVDVTVTTPEEIAGQYRVTLRRVVKASVQKQN